MENKDVKLWKEVGRKLNVQQRISGTAGKPTQGDISKNPKGGDITIIKR